MFMFQSQKLLHVTQILGTGTVGVYGEIMLATPSTDEIVHAIQVGAQVLIAVVTCIATIRKAFQKPTVIAPAQQENVQA